MADELIAARIDDPLVHSSLLGDFAAGLVEGAIYLAVFSAGAAMAASGVGVAIGAALVVGAMVNGFPERIGSMVSDAVDGLLDTLGMRGPPDALITSGSDNVLMKGKKAARAAGKVDHDFLNAPAPKAEDEPGALAIAMAMATSVADTVRHPGAFLSALGESISSINADSVGNFFKNVGQDIVQPTVASASPYATPADKDTVACSKGHMAESENFLAEGSKRVLINGHPAVRNGHRSTCEAKIEVADDPRVRIGGDSIVVRDIRSGKNFLAYFAGNLIGGGLGKELGQLGVQMLDRSVSRLMARLAVRKTACAIGGEAVGNAAAAAVGRLAQNAMATAHPVNIALGSKILAGQEDLDFVLQDRIPLYWQRIYHSRNRASGMLGSGWMLPFETRLLRVQAADGTLHFFWRDMSGRELGLGEVRPGDVIQFHEDGFTLYCTLQGVVVMQTAQGEFFLYEPDPTREGEWRIARQYDRHDNCLHFSWNDAGQLVSIASDNEALEVRLSYENAHGRLAAVHQQVDGAPQLRVRYAYNPQGQLIAVQDADGITTRCFGWDRASDLLASHSYATGLTVAYQWRPAADGENWRVSEYQVLDGEQSLEHWLIDADEQSRSATVTCLSGGSSEHRWDALYRITHYTDSYGAEWRYRWAAQGELLLSTTGPQGERWEYGYDERANLTQVKDPLGRSTLTVWHPVWALPEQEVMPDGVAWQYQYSALGDVVAVTDPQGAVTRYQWNAQGDLTCTIDALENTHRYAWDERGQLLHDEDCSGYQSHNQYDAAGRLAAHTDAAGNCTRYRWSAAGRLQRLIRPDGRETLYEYDAAGLLTGENIDGFSERKVKRNVRGQIVSEISPAGHVTRYQYDRFGRMTGLINANSDRWQFEYDSGERLLAQTDYAGRRKRYRYDQQGQVVEITQQPLLQAGEALAAHSTKMEYDALGRITARQTAEHRTEYRYQPRGITLRKVALAQWQQAQSAGQAVAWAEELNFTRDALGNLLSEENHGGLWKYQYDALGNLSQSSRPDGRALNFLRYGSGHLLQLNLQHAGQNQEITAYQRDALHREIVRSQGALSLETRYDRVGRIVMRRSPVLERRYQWDRLDQVAQQTLINGVSADGEAPFAQQRFGYDAEGQVTRRLRPQHEERFHYDPAGNRTDAPGQVVWHNLLQRLKGARWEYDGFGRLTWRRAARDGVEQHFAWDDEHRVSEVTLSGHREFSRVAYRYDLLGRRTQKILHRHGESPDDAEIVTFHWTGLQMVGEQSSRQPARSTQYIYAEGGWEPLARVDSVGESSETYWYHSELNGLPERMTDQYGEVVWQGSFSTWGETERESSPRGLKQNLRFQGQYFDAETGLHYNLFRYYDPVAGRFTQLDPIGLAGGLNTYAYVPDPLTIIDPLGLMPLSNPVNQGHHMVPHEVATHLDIAPFNSQTGVPAMYWDENQWTNIEHSAMHGYNGIGTKTKPLVKPSAVIKSGMSKEQWIKSLETHYNNPELKKIRGDVHLITSSGNKGELLAKNVTASEAWDVTKKWAKKIRCGGR